MKALICASLAVVITGLAVQTVTLLASEPRFANASTILVAQAHTTAAGSIMLAQAR